MTTYQSFCENITTQLFELINENGSLLKWQKSWNNRGCSLLPIGANGLYHGANIISLLISQMTEGLATHEWLTFNQIKKLNGCVKKGAKSKEVYFWNIINVKESESQANDNQAKRPIPIFKVYHVFNREQTTLDAIQYPNSEFKENRIENLLAKLNIKISHFGNKSYYQKIDDTIVLPQPICFSSKNDYYATLLHELTHWTGGNPNRVPRKCHEEYSLDIKARAEEELIAEIGSVLLTTHFNLRGELENHASYVQSWKENLNEKQVMNAAIKAAKAFEWIVKAGE